MRLCYFHVIIILWIFVQYRRVQASIIIYNMFAPVDRDVTGLGTAAKVAEPVAEAPHDRGVGNTRGHIGRRRHASSWRSAARDPTI